MASATHDVVVIGAGPAGASAAVTARTRGLSVALVDRAAFPRDKLCGGGVSGRAMGHLGQVFGDLPRDLFLPLSRVRLKFAGQIVGEHTDTPSVHMTMRRALDAAMVDHARGLGANVLTGAKVVGLDPSSGVVTLSDGSSLQGRVVVGADGVNSGVARRLFGRAYDPARIGFALEVEVPRDRPDPEDAVEIDLGAADWGYGWAFPKHGSVTLGVGGVAPRNPDMKAHLARYLTAHGVEAGAHRVKGAFLPFGDVRPVPGAGRVLLAGDAAGLVDPITGEGIGWAVCSGQIAAMTAVCVLAGGQPDGAADAYRRALAPVHTELRRAGQLRALIYSRPLRPHFATMLRQHPGLQRRYLALLAGQIDYADLGLATFARMVWRMGTAPFRGPGR
ncbi:MAG: geranylgeranyl reductase family protein [Gemmobacter sp.]|nr:geranylgeranyl reductase family protein [Gemmobacter sp.]